MSEFCDKFDLKESQMEAMIKSGWLTCSLPFYEKVVYHYKKSQSYQKTADEHGISKSEVRYIVAKFKV